MDNMKYITVAVLEAIVQAIPSSISSDTVSIEIRRLSDDYTWNFTALEFQNASNTGSMIFISGELWKQSYTPPTANTYIATITDITLDVKYYLIYSALGEPPTVPSAPTGIDLETYSNVKAYMGLANDDEKTLISNLITRVSTFISTYCNRIFHDTDYTEYHNGKGQKSICLKQYPVNSIASLYDDPNRDYGSDYLINSSYYIFDESSGIVTLDGYTFSIGLHNIKATYNAGYETIPADLRQACIELVSMKFNHKEKEGISSEKIGSYSVSYTSEELPLSIKQVLNKYKKMGVY